MVDSIVHGPIDIAAFAAEVGGAAMGASTIFSGTVRRSEADGPIVAIEYSAYEDMARLEFEKILAETSRRWPDGKFAVCHRLGRVELGEASIVIAASTPHRAESFDACRFVIEEVKARLPVWKKEIFEDGSEGWRENGPVDSSD